MHYTIKLVHPEENMHYTIKLVHPEENMHCFFKLLQDTRYISYLRALISTHAVHNYTCDFPERVRPLLFAGDKRLCATSMKASPLADEIFITKWKSCIHCGFSVFPTRQKCGFVVIHDLALHDQIRITITVIKSYCYKQ